MATLNFSMGPDHEFIEVGDRRWCVGCGYSQQRPAGKPWWTPRDCCPRDTPYAKDADKK